METLSTAGLPAADRMLAWNDLYSSRMSRSEFIPVDEHRFDAELSISQLGPIKLAKLRVDQCRAERTPQHLAQSPRLYSFVLQARGSSVFSHCGHEAHLSEGDFVLCDTGLPHRFETGSPSVTIMVRVLPEVLRELLPTFEQFCGLHLSHAVGLTSTAGAMVQSLSDKVDFGSRPEYEERVARYLLEMISISYAMGFDSGSTGSVARRQRRNEVVRYIENNLRDPSLTAESVANGVSLSTRYIRTLFSDSGETVADYIRRRRVEDCARKMRDPAWRGTSLMKIAASSGFNSAAHFSRCFRAHFEVTPREYRRERR